MLPSYTPAQTIDLTAANPSFDIGSGTYAITGLTVANGVNGIITGTGGTLDYSGGNPFLLGSTTGGQIQNLNMSGLSNFIFNNASQVFQISGRYPGSGNSSNTSSALTLAANSVITASSFGVGNVQNSAANAVRNIGTVNLGQATAINANTIDVGAGPKTQGTMTLQAGGMLVLRGTDASSPVANWNIGTGSNSTLVSTLGSVDLSAGTVDANVGNLLIGQSGAGGTQTANGTLILGNGTLDAASIVLARTTATSTSNVAATLTVGSATVTTQTLTLGDHLSPGGTITATVNLNNGGTLKAGGILPGSGAATRTINWAAGTIGNYASGQNMTISIPTIAMSGAAAHTFDIQGAGAIASVSSVVSGADAVLTKTGAGVLALSGANTYSGGTAINGGLINFAALSNLGTGNMTLNGGGLQWATGNTVDVSARLNPLGTGGAFFDTNGNTVTLAGALTGSGGALNKQGTGTLILAGANSYSGGTRIDAGTLQIGAGGAAGSVIGNVVNNGTLAFNRSDALTFDGGISGSGGVSQLGAGTTTFTADQTYTGHTLIAAGTLQLGNGGTSGSVVGDVLNDGVLAVNRADTLTLSGTISGSGTLSQRGSGTTILTADNTYTGGSFIAAGTLQLGNGGSSGGILGNITDNGTLAFNRSDAVAFSDIISGTGGINQIGPGTLQLGGDQTYTGPTQVSAGTLALLGSLQSNTVTVAPGATLSGTGIIHGNVLNQGRVWPGSAIAGATDYASLTVQGNYVGQNGMLELNAFLGGDGSPSDRLVIDGGMASGNTSVLVHNTSTSSAVTRGDGILVVSAIHGGTTTADAFNLPGEVRRGALDYRLFRGSKDGTAPDSWYLRNEFTVLPPEPEPEPEPPKPVDPDLPIDPPDEEILPPGDYPIIGPELATYGAVQPLARELGQRTLSTLHERVGDSTPTAAAQGDTDHGPTAWGRVFGATIDQSYRAFAAPSSKGNLSGFQVGVDMWQGQSPSGHTDSFGGYMAYGRANVDVQGLVTNDEATGYVRQRTGSLNLQATSVGAYWTHYGPTGWYLDGVAQASTYRGSASTPFARLNLPGTGFVASLEFGYPIAWPHLGESFVLEPQLQAIYQYVNFSPRNDGLGPVAIGSTHGNTGRAGLRGKWQLTGHNGQLWTPYVGLDVRRDWGARSKTEFGASGGDYSAMPMVPQATLASLNGGLTAQLSPGLSVYGAAGYEHDLGNSDNARRRGFDAHLGLRYAW